LRLCHDLAEIGSPNEAGLDAVSIQGQPILAGQLDQTASLLANRSRGFVHLDALGNRKPKL